ncbi:MAG: tail fiber protein [Acidovorax sp.]|uniref:phage tail protein n=1 Tax=Acidovorax sp. TaxID=1872122 RepID=UPI0025BD44F0|nr:tail fiber protein [Acidovorax sp.]MCE1191425.1 tail fiber protein [Acidovorax sp.]
MSEAFIGEIRLFAGNFAPQHWSFCDGSLLPIAEYDAAYALLGTTYGGDGVTTFAVPDLRGRLPIGVGQGPGLSLRVLGEQVGVEQVTLLANNAPAHTHALAAGAAASNVNPAGLAPAAVTGFNLYAASTTAPQALAGSTVDVAGGGMPHNNVMPSMPLSFIVCLNGIFPSRN